MFAPNRILYVDDNRDACELAAVMFDHLDADCHVTAAESAEEALRLIEKERFDIYIFDYRLPEMSGIELCRRVRQSDARTPILFFSAMARPSDVSAARAAGANDYLIKPNDLDKLPQTVKRMLNQRPPLIKRESATVKTILYSGLW